MNADVTVTIEFQKKAPITWKGEIDATTPGTISNRGIREAFKVNKNGTRGWSSVVAVVERVIEDVIEVELEEESSNSGSEEEEEETAE